MIALLMMGTPSFGVKNVRKKEESTIMPYLEQKPTAISDRIISMRLPLKKNHYATILSAYAPTMTNPEEKKRGFTIN